MKKTQPPISTNGIRELIVFLGMCSISVDIQFLKYVLINLPFILVSSSFVANVHLPGCRLVPDDLWFLFC